MPRDFYETLGISRGAAPEEIKTAYRRLARKFHPDVNREEGAEERFKEINEAYAVLSDPEKRKLYDLYGESALHGGGPGVGASVEDLFDQFGFGDIFDTFFGRRTSGRRRPSSAQGRDLLVEVELDLEEVDRGVEREIEYAHTVSCKPCRGTGAEGGALEKCRQCRGTGEVRRQSQSFLGSMVTVTTCPLCQGSGSFPQEPCGQCHGRGVAEEKKKIRIRIPAGVEEGGRIRIEGHGEAVKGGVPGDLYVQIRYKPHPFFQADGAHLRCEIPVTFCHLALGGELDVPTLRGKEKIKIEPGTESHSVFILRGKGLSTLRGRAGDLFVTVKVFVPKKMSREQKELVKKLDPLHREALLHQHRPLFEALKDLFGR